MSPNKKMIIGLVSPWPTVKNAEYEIIERIKIALAGLGHRHLIVDSYGRVLEGGSQTELEQADFCISMHFISPKLWQPFTYLAMWNPPRYYHDADYDRVMSHVGSYDDYLLYDSAPIKNHLLNYLRHSDRSLDGALEFYSGGAGECHRPLEKLPSSPALFYCGINWERLSGTHGRHHHLLQLLDKSGLTKIYGPEKFEGIRPWAGFKTFQGSIPFDGSSLLLKLRECGVALVLSSYDHIKSEAASNRVYEACAAGVAILSDRNPFIMKEFGNRVRYFDYAETWEGTFENIRREFQWICEHPSEAAALARSSQEHYLTKYTLESGLKSLIESHPHRSTAVARQLDGSLRLQADVISVVNSESEDDLKEMIQQLQRQSHTNFCWIVVGPSATIARLKHLLHDAQNIQARLQTVAVDFLINGFQLPRFSTGALWLKALEYSQGDWLTSLCPQETWHERHLAVLAGVFERDLKTTAAYSGSYVQARRENRRDLRSFGLPLSQAGRIVRLEATLKDLPVAIRRSVIKSTSEFAPLLSLLEDNILLFFWLMALQAGSPGFTQYLSVMYEEKSEDPNRDRISINLIRDYFRNDPAYRRLVTEYPLMYTGDISFHTIRRVVLDFIRPKVERTHAMPFVRWIYRKFITRLIY